MTEIILNITPFLNWILNIFNYVIQSGVIFLVIALLGSISAACIYDEKINDWSVLACVSLVFWGFGILLFIGYYNIMSFRVI